MNRLIEVAPPVLRVDFVVIQGDTWVPPGFQLLESDRVSPRDLTGYRYRLQGRATPGAAVLLDLTTENGGILVDMETATIRPTLTAEQTSALCWAECQFDFQETAPDNRITTFVRGKIKVTREITK